jgi:hypothetical protein
MMILSCVGFVGCRDGGRLIVISIAVVPMPCFNDPPSPSANCSSSSQSLVLSFGDKSRLYVASCSLITFYGYLTIPLSK